MKKDLKNFNKGEIIIYKDAKEGEMVEVRLENESIWLTQAQVAALFGVDRTVVTKHIKNIFKEGELNRKSTSAKIAQVQKEGQRQVERDVEFYNLDVVLSVGYRINSKRATQFRIWANKVLKDFLVRGYAINQKRLAETKEKFEELKQAVAFLQTKSKREILKDQAGEIINLISDYSKTLSILEQYDADSVKEVKGEKSVFVLSFGECTNIVKKLRENIFKKGEDEVGELFGKERDGAFEGVMKGIYQTFGSAELYNTIEDKSAHLLYFVIKDHPFFDGNKRIASFLFIYFLDKNNYLYKTSGEKKINDNALVAISLLIAESDPNEKEIIIKILKNLLNE